MNLAQYEHPINNYGSKKVYTCQDLEHELLMEQDFNRPLRCSTPVNMDNDEKNRVLNGANFITLWLHLTAAQSSWLTSSPESSPFAYPAYPASLSSSPASSLSPPPLSSADALAATTNTSYTLNMKIMLNQMRAEAMRKQHFGKIYSGPISNSASHRSKY